MTEGCKNIPPSSNISIMMNGRIGQMHLFI